MKCKECNKEIDKPLKYQLFCSKKCYNEHDRYIYPTMKKKTKVKKVKQHIYDYVVEKYVAKNLKVV